MWQHEQRDGMSRRAFLSHGAAFGAAMGAGTLALLSGCASRPPAKEVVLYSSVDEPILRPIVEVFEKQSGIAVRVVGDTEATKSTGLIERLIAEGSSPRADVWWSGEQLGVIELAKRGLLEPMEPSAVKEFAGGWPKGLRDPQGLWYGFALRARVIAFSTKRVAEAPRTLGTLLHERFKGRVGIANPAFGTTRVHLAALVAERGEAATRAWIGALKANGLRVYPGNSAVVRAISQGEIDVGLTDTDDVYAGKASGWAVDMVYEDVASPDGFGGGGALVLPNTVARIKGGPNPASAMALIEFILSENVARLLAASDSRNMPIHEKVLAEFPALTITRPWNVDGMRIAAALPASSAIAREILGPV